MPRTFRADHLRNAHTDTHQITHTR